MSEYGLTNAADSRLIELLVKARRRIVFMAPGLSEAVAKALVDGWERLASGAVQVVLDVDSEVCRLGYGTLAGLKLLKDRARSLERTINHQPGIRIGIIVSDDKTLVFSPTPLLIEEGSKQADRPNAILLEAVPTAVATDLGLQRGHESERVVGLHPLDEIKMKTVEHELEIAPPQRFDLARQVRVYTTYFQFVELGLNGCFLSRKKVRIPSSLLGLTRSPEVERNLEAHFSLVADGTVEVHTNGRKLTETSLRTKRREIEENFIIPLKDYGSVVLRSKKTAFEKAVGDLRLDVELFRKGVHNALQERIEEARAAVVEALLPLIESNPPKSWDKFHDGAPSRHFLRSQLETDIARAFGDANDHIEEMSVKLVFKDVAYESLVDEKFLARARSALRGIDFHEVFDAAVVRTEPS